jgi:predicted RNase H-like HicB family nuclease
MTFTVEYEQEDDGRWLAEVLELPGALAYGQTHEEAIAKAQALALRCSPTSSNTARARTSL